MNKHVLKNDFLELEYLIHSLRISGLTPKGRSNLFADLSHQPPVSTPYGDFYFRGGHRLWHAPEAMPRTYIPDTPVTIIELSDGVRLEAQTEPGTGIRKSIEIRLAGDGSSVTLTHELTNDGMWPLELAPWAITQFRLGGTAVLPMPVSHADTTGLLHNRQFSLWPYTRFSDPRVKWGDESILFKADPLLPPFKIGYFNPHGWLAYYVDGILFRKTFPAQTNVAYPDNNCNAEMYCNNQFVELESVGPLTTLRPGEMVTHVETWELLDGLDSLPQDIQKAISIS